MPALRLMNYNVHLPSTALAAAQGIADTADDDAKVIAKAINNLPIRERPDVIVFNEVFHETARATLISKLGSWPHVIKKLGNGLLPPEDSGLLLLSKFPFVPLPTGNTHEFEAFEEVADTDQGAAKGIAMVRINTPISPTTIVFTHMQASYDAANSEYENIRRMQLDQIISFLKDKLGQSASAWPNVVLVGDVNIKGDGTATTSEWNRIFEPPGQHEFGTIFTDGWRTHMHPPTSLAEKDPGFTNFNPDTATLNRLDYQCFKRVDPFTRQIVPHHMSIPLREHSDHWSLLGRLQLFTAASTPNTAVDVIALLPISTAPPGQAQSNFRIAELSVGQEGGYQWAYISKKGTFSLFLPPNFEWAVFTEDDLTHRLASASQIAIAELPSEIQPELNRRGFVPKGETFATRMPFFVRVRSTTETGTGDCPLGVLEHRGDSMATAIHLIPDDIVDPQLPAGQKLGSDDHCWFVAEVPKKFDELPYGSDFVLRNPAAVSATVTLRDAAGKPLPPATAASTASEIKTSATVAFGKLFLTLARASTADTKFTMQWLTLLSFLHLKKAISLHVDDETEINAGSEDEFDLVISVDNETLLSDEWDDADAGEDWPDLHKKIRDAVTLKLGAIVSDIAFDSGIVVSLLKTDGISASGSVGGIVDPLKASEQPVEIRTEAIVVRGLSDDGQLTFKCTISKFPSGKA